MGVEVLGVEGPPCMPLQAALHAPGCTVMDDARDRVRLAAYSTAQARRGKGRKRKRKGKKREGKTGGPRVSCAGFHV